MLAAQGLLTFTGAVAANRTCTCTTGHNPWHRPWRGRQGLVHQAVLQDHPDLSGFDVYACGAPVMVDAARQDFNSQAGLPTDQFYADAFTSERDKLA